MALAGLGVAGALIFTPHAHAHHPFAAEYSRQHPVTLSGVVTKVAWTNPHIHLYMNVRSAESGKVSNWTVEMGAPHLLQRRGWRRNTLTTGTQITVDGFLARNGSSRINAQSVTLMGGVKLDAGSSQLDRNTDN
ncbi:DUF6152 family protein [Magnetofaba australis]|nr:DUF6152 family protein [Magnetofaba australis]